MEIIVFLLSAAVMLYLSRRQMSNNKRLGAAFNLLLAKYTFDRLSEADQEKVEKRANEIAGVAIQGHVNGFNGEVEKYGWYALTMNELGIQPAVQHQRWNKVKNLSAAILPGDPYLDMATRYLKQKFNVDVSVSGEGH